MTIDQLRKRHRALPFQPFRIHLADGRELDVPHPEMLAVMPPGRRLVVATGNEDYEVFDLLLVTSLEVVHGRGKRPREKD